MSDELADKLEWCCQWTLNDFGKQYAAEPPFYQMPHLVSVWRLIHLLAMRRVIAMRAASEAHIAGSSRNKPAPSYVLLQFYVGAVNRLVCAVHDAAVKEPDAKGKLTLRDTLTGAPLPLGSWKKPDFRPAVEWFDAIKKRDMVLTYDLLYEWRCDGIHFDEAVTVVPSEFIQWAEAAGISPPGELARLLAGIVPGIEAEERAFADPSSAPPASADERGAEPTTASGGAPAGDRPPQDEPGLTKRENQIRAIEQMADEMKFKRLCIPYGGKAALLNACKEKWPKLFGGGDDSFLGAWQDALNAGRIRMANHDKHSNKKK